MSRPLGAFLLTLAAGPIGPLAFGRYALAAGLLALNLGLILALGTVGVWAAWACNAFAGVVLAAEMSQ